MQLVFKRPLAASLITALVVPILVACSGASTQAPPTSAPIALQTSPLPPEPSQAPAAPSEAPAEPTDAPAANASGIELPEVNPLEVSGNIISSGSSTVFPLSQAMAQRFQDEGYTGDITIDSVGTGGGFERFCVAAETDIANASRAIKPEEREKCQSNGRDPIEFRVGTDALAVVVSSENNFIEGLNFAQLAAIFNGDAKVWSDLDASYPSEPIQIYSPGSDSGTYDYFVEVVLGNDDSKLQTSGAQFSENDNVLVQGVEGSPYAIGYFGFAYYHEAAGKLRAIPIAKEGDDYIEPNASTAEDGSYPLARPLYIYSDAKIMAEKPQVAAFINFYLSYVNEEIAEVGYFPASQAALDQAKQNFLDAGE